MCSNVSRKMKLTVGAMAVFAMVMSAQAFIVINFDSVGGYVGYNEPALLANLINGGLVQVLWSSDNQIGELSQSTAMPTGNDRILEAQGGTDSWYLNSFGQVTGAAGSGVRFNTPGDLTDGEFLSGYVYIRVFDSATPVLNDHYVSGSALGVGQIWGSLTGDSGGVVNPNDEEQIDLTRAPDAVIGEFGARYVPLNMTIVPEPATFALFGIGLVTLMARRRLRK